jgi:hypothetical protein
VRSHLRHRGQRTTPGAVARPSADPSCDDVDARIIRARAHAHRIAGRAPRAPALQLENQVNLRELRAAVMRVASAFTTPRSAAAG